MRDEHMHDATAGFWSVLEAQEREALSACGIRRRYARGRAVFVEESAPSHVMVVRRGRFKVSSHTRDGREMILAVRGPGELIGELSALDGEPRSASVAALEDAEALVVAAGDFTAFLHEHPRVAVLLIRMLAGRLREADRKRVEFGAHDTAGRLALHLVELAERYGEDRGADGVVIDLPMSQEELAGWMGASREAVSKALRSLRTRGWITTHRRRIVIHDLASLRRRAT